MLAIWYPTRPCQPPTVLYSICHLVSFYSHLLELGAKDSIHGFLEPVDAHLHLLLSDCEGWHEADHLEPALHQRAFTEFSKFSKIAKFPSILEIYDAWSEREWEGEGRREGERMGERMGGRGEERGRGNGRGRGEEREGRRGRGKGGEGKEEGGRGGKEGEREREGGEGDTLAEVCFGVYETRVEEGRSRK